MRQHLRVLEIIPNFRYGGAERMSVNLMCGLAARGLDVGAVSLFDRSDTDLETELQMAGVPVWYLGKRLGFDPQVYARLGRVLRQFNPDVVHTHLSVLRYAWPLRAYRRVNAKVHTVHSIADKEVDGVGRWVHSVAFRTGVVPVAVSEAVSTSLRSIYGLRQAALIRNGIPVSRYAVPEVSRASWRRREHLSEGVVLFVSVGSLTAAKNPLLLLTSFAIGPGARNSGSQLVFVGEGPLRGSLGGQASAMGLADRVRFLGLRADIRNVLAACDVFISSSDYEGNPLAVMEAMAAGKPVIATAVGGVPELLEHGKTGLLVPRGDAQALAGAMSRLLGDEAMRLSMGHEGASKAKRLFDVDAMVEAYERLYRTLLDRQRAREVSGQ